jgi:hypothetical protein
MEWEALRGRRRAGADAPENAGAHGLNNSWGYVERCRRDLCWNLIGAVSD